MPWFWKEKFIKNPNWYALHDSYEEHNSFKKVRKYIYTNKKNEEQAFSLYRYFNKSKSIDFIDSVNLSIIDGKFKYDFLESSADILRYINFKDPYKIKSITLEIVDKNENFRSLIFSNNHGSVPFPIYGLPLTAMYYNTIIMTIEPLHEDMHECIFMGRWSILNYNMRKHYSSLSHLIDFGNELYEIIGGIILNKKHIDLLTEGKKLLYSSDKS